MHEKYVRPSYILERDHVTLFVRTPEYAVFVVTEREVNIYDTKKFPFLSAGQAAEARYRERFDNYCQKRTCKNAFC